MSILSQVFANDLAAILVRLIKKCKILIMECKSNLRRKYISSLLVLTFQNLIKIAVLTGGLSNLHLWAEDTVLSYQGRVAVDGSPFTGNGAFKFAIMNQAGSKSYWSNDGSSVGGSEPIESVQLSVSKGLFAVRLGEVTLPGMDALALEQVLMQNLMLRVWFNDGSKGWQQLVPDSKYDPPAGMLNLLRRTELLEDNDFIWKVDAFVFHNGGKQPKRSNAVWEAFSDQNGYRDSLSISTPGAIYDGQLRVVRIVVTDQTAYNVPSNSGSDVLLKTYSINRRIGSVKMRCAHNVIATTRTGTVNFLYGDGTSASIGILFRYFEDSGALISVNNPQPVKVVTSVTVRGNTSNITGGLTVSAFEALGPDQVSATVSLPAVGTEVTRFRVAVISDNEIGDVIQYSVSNGTTTLSELEAGVTYDWSGNSNPTSLQLHLIPAPAGSWQKTGVSSIAFFYDGDD
jgi:hypothetical protein